MTADQMATKGFTALQAAKKAGNKFTSLLRDYTTADDYSVACLIADKAVASLPEDKGEDGKDRNSQERNDYIRTIRRALAIVGKERGVKLTIKRVEGAHVVSVVKPGEEPQEEEGGKPGNGASEGGQDDEAAEEARQDAMWAAVEVVLANLGNPAVLSAIRTGLEKMAQQPQR